MIKVGFDAKRLFNNFTGLGNYSRSLLRDLSELYPKNEYHLYSPKFTNNYRTTPFLNNILYKVHSPSGVFKKLWRSLGIKKDLKKDGIDVFHGLSHEIPFGIDKTGIKTVVTMHDIIFKKFPNQYSKIDNRIYDYKFRYACEKSDKIMASSKSTARDLQQLYKIDESKIEVVYLTCGPHFFDDIDEEIRENVKKKYNLPSEFLLFVGSIIERKNLFSVIKAMELLPENLKIPLIVIGKGSTHKKKIQKYIEQKKLGKWVIFIKDVFYSELPSLYNLSSIFLMPSMYEGFGLPVLEAMLSGTPVITSNSSSLPEVGGPSSIYVQHSNISQIAEAIQLILSDSEKAKQMISDGKTYAQNFHSNIITPQVVKIYQDLKDS